LHGFFLSQRLVNCVIAAGISLTNQASSQYTVNTEYRNMLQTRHNAVDSISTLYTYSQTYCFTSKQ